MSTNYYKKSIDAFENFKEEPRNKYGEYRTPDSVDLEPKKTEEPVPVVETANVEPVEVVEEAVEVKETKKSKKSKTAESEKNASDDIADAIFGSETAEEA